MSIDVNVLYGYKKKVIFLWLSLLFFLTACFILNQAPPLKIEEANQINKIEIEGSIEKDSDKIQFLFVIESEEKINKIIHFLNEHNNGWFYPMGTMPIYPYTAYFLKNKEWEFSIFLGLNESIGGKDRNNRNRLKYFSSAEEKYLFDLMGL